MATETPIGTRIRRARERRKWTQQQLADAVNVDVKTVRNWESGRSGDIRNRIGAIEEVLGISLDGDDSGERPEYDDPALQRVWERTDGVPDEQRRDIMRAVEEMREGAVAVPDELRRRFRERYGHRPRRAGNGSDAS